MRAFGPSGGQGTTENVMDDGLPSTTLSGNRSPTIRTVQFPTQVEGVLDRDNEDEHAVRVLGWAARVATMGLQTCRTARRFGRLLDRLGRWCSTTTRRCRWRSPTLRYVAESDLDWSEIDPSILGTLFERGLDPGAPNSRQHYTDRDKIMLLLEPVPGWWFARC